VEIRQLRYFLAVAETRHFGRAAERLHMAQSPLSQAIRSLEADLGVRLFDRNTRRVDLTPAGEALQDEAARIIASVDAARAQVEQVAAGRLGVLRCGVTGLAVHSQVPPLVRRVAEHLPGLALEFQADLLTPDQETALLEHRIDLGILRPPLRSPELATTLLTREFLVLVVPDGHPATAAVDADGAVALAEVRDDDVVEYAAAGSVVNGAAHRACLAAGFAPRTRHAAEQTSVVLALVAGGAGVALLPGSVTALGIAGVRYLPLRDPVQVDLALAWRRDDPSRALARLLALVAGVTDPRHPTST